MKNLGLKLAALVLACVVWFIVSGPRREQTRQRMVTASLSLVGLPPDLVITTDVRSSVAVRVKGRISDLRSLASHAATKSATSQSRSVTPAAIAGRHENANAGRR